MYQLLFSFRKFTFHDLQTAFFMLYQPHVDDRVKSGLSKLLTDLFPVLCWNLSLRKDRERVTGRRVWMIQINDRVTQYATLDIFKTTLSVCKSALIVPGFHLIV